MSPIRTRIRGLPVAAHLDRLSPSTIVYTVADRFRVTPLQILSEDRSTPLPKARMAVSLILSCCYTPEEIASFPGKAESTVRYYLREGTREFHKEGSFRKLVEEILLA